MFREMRRKKQQLSREETIQILENGKTAVLGLLGDDGYPYTVPVNYVFFGEKIYFHCAREGHKLDAIRQNGKVSLCVVEKDDVIPEKLTTYFRSVILFGQAKILESNTETARITECFAQKYVSDRDAIAQSLPKGLPGLCIVEITIDHMTGKTAAGLMHAQRA